MAKFRVNPESFRVGTFQHWNDSVKLLNYNTNIRLKSALSLYNNSYWFANRHSLNVLKASRKSARRRLWKFRKQKFSLITAGVEIRRRRIKVVNYSFLRKMRYPASRYGAGLMRSFLRKSKIKRRKKRTIFDRWKLKGQKLIIRRKNRILYKTLKLQRFLPYTLDNTFFNMSTAVAGSTALRRYQFSLNEVQPPQWTIYMHLKRHSFKRTVGHLSIYPQIKHYNFRYTLLLSQLNMALHWRSGELFLRLLKIEFEKKKRTMGFLKLVQGTLNRMYINRYNISTIYLMATGSFGKLTRTRAIRIGPRIKQPKHSLTALSQPVNYSNIHVHTPRGTIGLRVWLFWVL